MHPTLYARVFWYSKMGGVFEGVLGRFWIRIRAETDTLAVYFRFTNCVFPSLRLNRTHSSANKTLMWEKAEFRVHG
jgi:hypothetical protein